VSTCHVRAGEGRHHRMIDGDHIAKAVIRDAGGSFEVFEVVVAAGPMAPPHVAPWTGVLFLLQGRITAVVDGASHDVEPGGLLVVPAGRGMTFAVVGGSARFLAITSGDGAGRFFADFAGSVPLDRPIEDVADAIRSVTGRHGVAVAGP
jgi:quercetin dioxygenase-like cupin family protein